MSRFRDIGPWLAEIIAEMEALGFGSEANPTSPVAVVGGHRFQTLAVGGVATCGITQAGQPLCWGFNPDGQLGDGTTVSRDLAAPAGLFGALRLAAGVRHTCAIRSTDVLCWGTGYMGSGGGVQTLLSPELADERYQPEGFPVHGGIGRTLIGEGPAYTYRGGGGRKSKCLFYMCWADCATYADWAGLRPMTELEFEKACRGPLKPVPDEYAWGTAAVAGSNSKEPPRDGYALRNAGQPSAYLPR